MTLFIPWWVAAPVMWATIFTVAVYQEAEPYFALYAGGVLAGLSAIVAIQVKRRQNCYHIHIEHEAEQ